MSVWFNDAYEPIEVCEVPWSVVWLCPARNLFVIVDTIDLAFAQQWLWTPISTKSGPTRAVKWYARRSLGMWNEGTRHRSINVWLHKEILLRAKGPSKRKSATIGDHQNGNSLDCRRGNLEWATSSENRRNLYGSLSHQLRLGFNKVTPRHLSTPRFEEQRGLYDD